MLKLLLSDQHHLNRLKWAKANQDTDWDKVLFTDETTVNKGIRHTRVWHQPGEKMVKRTVKHPVGAYLEMCQQ